MRPATIIWATGFVSVLATMSWAQEQDAGRRILEEQQRRERLEELERGQAGQQVTTPEAKGVVEEAVCFPIDDIELTGVTILRGEKIDAIVREFSGKCIGQVSIGNLLGRIRDNKYEVLLA